MKLIKLKQEDNHDKKNYKGYTKFLENELDQYAKSGQNKQDMFSTQNTAQNIAYQLNIEENDDY